MRKVMLSVICMGILALVGSVAMAGELESNYDEAICKYYGVKQAEVDAVRAQGLSDEDIPVAFHIAKRGKTSAERIASMHARGDSWSEIVHGRNMNPEIFYIPVSGEVDSFTYGPILGQYRATPDNQWRKLNLTDADVVNMVNLKMAASGYDYNIFKIMGLRDEGKGFVQICHEVKEAKDVIIAEQRAARRAATANAGM